MIATWLTLAALHGRWQVCPLTSTYRGRSFCTSWTPTQEFKIDANTGRMTLLTTQHFGGRARFCHFADVAQIVEAAPRGRRFRLSYRRIESTTLERDAKYEACAAARGTVVGPDVAWTFHQLGDQVLVIMPDGMKAHMLRRMPEP